MSFFITYVIKILRCALKHKKLYPSTAFFMFILIRRIWMIGDNHPYFSPLISTNKADMVNALVIIVFGFFKYRLHKLKIL